SPAEREATIRPSNPAASSTAAGARSRRPRSSRIGLRISPPCCLHGSKKLVSMTPALSVRTLCASAYVLVNFGQAVIEERAEATRISGIAKSACLFDFYGKITQDSTSPISVNLIVGPHVEPFPRDGF